MYVKILDTENQLVSAEAKKTVGEARGGHCHRWYNRKETTVLRYFNIFTVVLKIQPAK